MLQSYLEVKHPVCGRIPNNLITAKEGLRDQLFRSVEQSMPQAVALRKANRFRSAPGVNLVGLGIGEKVTAGKRTGPTPPLRPEQ